MGLNVTGAGLFSVGAWQLLVCLLFLERRSRAHRTQLARTKRSKTLAGSDGVLVAQLFKASRKLEELGSDRRDTPVSGGGGGGMERCA